MLCYAKVDAMLSYAMFALLCLACLHCLQLCHPNATFQDGTLTTAPFQIELTTITLQSNTNNCNISD